MTDIQSKIDNLVKNNAVVLFMKGTREHPQCGFSRQVVDALRKLINDFITVDVLSDPHLREGIKAYSSWPTLPQLYVNGEFIGGCDIVLDLQNKNQLADILQAEKATKAPELIITEPAINAFKNALKDEEGYIRIVITADFEHSLQFDDKHESDFVVVNSGVTFLIDPYSAFRADNLRIDFTKDALESGFAFVNPNEPPPVQEISPKDFIDNLPEAMLIDVRPKDEWLKAHIENALRLEELAPSEIAKIDKNKAIVFHCHHGQRSLRMAQVWRRRGFRNVYSLAGGIDAWSKQVNMNIPLY